MTRWTLWRLDGATSLAQIDEVKLATGLRHHLRNAPLRTILVQRAGHQQAYIALPACPACAEGRGEPCVPGCYQMLFQRLLAASAPGLQVVRVGRGLKPQTVRRAVVAWPGQEAQGLDGSLLHASSAATLVVHAAPRRRGIGYVAVLGVEGQAPILVAALKERGWQALAVHRALLPLASYWLRHSHTAPLPFTRTAALSPALVLPIPVPETPATTVAAQAAALPPEQDEVPTASAPGKDQPSCTSSSSEYHSSTTSFLQARLALAVAGFAPIAALALTIAGIWPLWLGVCLLVLPTSGVALMCWRKAPACARRARIGLVAGLLAVLTYDAARWATVGLGLWGDFIPILAAGCLDSRNPTGRRAMCFAGSAMVGAWASPLRWRSAQRRVRA